VKTNLKSFVREKIELSKYLIWFKDNKNIKIFWIFIIIDKLKIWNEVENVKNKFR